MLKIVCIALIAVLSCNIYADNSSSTINLKQKAVPLNGISFDQGASVNELLGLEKQNYWSSKDVIESALKLAREGKVAESTDIFRQESEKGDVKSMTMVATAYYNGKGATQDFKLAAEWHAKGVKFGDGDAFSNLSRQFREGEGVEKNVKIAYNLGLLVHYLGLGSDDTQYRAGANIGKARDLLTDAEQKDALSYTTAYVIAFALHLGKLDSQLEALKHDPKYPTIKQLTEFY